MTRVHDLQAVVTGGGTAGAAAAYQLARRGLRVALVERRPLEQAGARWVNAVPPWMFDRGGIPRPEVPELVGTDFEVHLLDREGRERIRLGKSPMWNIDMRALVARLHRLAADAGVWMIDRAEVTDLERQGERPTLLRLRQGRADEGGETLALRASLFVDASGISGELRRRVPDLDRHCPDLDPEDWCHAVQQVRRIRDGGGARDFLARYRATGDDALSFVGIEGGFSTLTVKVLEQHGTFEILAGSIDDGHHKNGLELIKAFLATEPWVGEVIYGGGGRIPLRRPYARQAAPGIALIGNAGCQVFPAHGSGVGCGLVAARLLADSVAGHADPGSVEATWAYQAAFMREVGAVHAAYDAFRRLSQRLDSRSIGHLLASGLMTRTSSRAALEQHIPTFRAGDLVTMASAVLRHPSLTAQFAPTVARMNALAFVYRAYPLRPSLKALRRWAAVESRLGGTRSDLA